MTTPENKTKNWQDWLTDLKHAISADGWYEFMNALGMEEAELEQWAVLYMLPVQTDLCNAMLLACLQTTPAEVDSTLNSIQKTAHELRFGKPTRNMKRKLKALYNESTRQIARILPSTADMLESVFQHYVLGEYDTQHDVNLLVREALTQSVARNRDTALALFGKAGAAALRGCHVWDGWADEGPDEFRQWALSLTTLLEHFARLLPMSEISAERQRSAERATMLSTVVPRSECAGEANIEALEDAELDGIATEFSEVLSREKPLSDEEINQLGKRYQQYGQVAIRSLEMIGASSDLDDLGEVLEMSIEVLGMLRYADTQAIQMLINIIVNQNDEYDEETVDTAVWSLQQMGQAVIKPALDFARYSSLEKPRADMLEVLAVAGRGSEESFNYLAGQFNETPWANNKTLYATSLALTHDPRAVSLLIDALRNPAVTENDAWALLDALQELDVTFYINADNRSVNIPDHGIIEDVLPVNWKSRQELADEDAEEEWDDGEDDDEDDKDEYEEVVYDKEGIPRCPDCGAEMHFIAGRWVHFPPSIKPK